MNANKEDAYQIERMEDHLRRIRDDFDHGAGHPNKVLRNTIMRIALEKAELWYQRHEATIQMRKDYEFENYLQHSDKPKF